jgi:hypothetical protein
MLFQIILCLKKRFFKENTDFPFADHGLKLVKKRSRFFCYFISGNNFFGEMGRIFILSVFVVAVFLFLAGEGNAQSYNYWTRNFNEESLLASGVVVGGGAGSAG